MLSTGARRWRAVVTAVALVLLLAGSLWGQDDHFPFGPFRMYARASRPDGQVSTPFLVAVRADGTEEQVRSDVFGLRPAELEGQYPRLRAQPELLGALAAEYEARTPGEPPVVELRLMRRVRDLVDFEVVRETVREVAVWRRP